MTDSNLSPGPWPLLLMRYALIIAGGSGTRLWPMSRSRRPKQLIPFVHGRSLLQLTMDRLEGLTPADRRYICAGRAHRAAILEALPGFDPQHFLGEPIGRDTLNAVGLGAAVIAQRDPDATIAVLTADHIIEPADRFAQIVQRGFALAEAAPATLVTFGIEPTHPATGYGYLELGEPIAQGQARRVQKFKEKPDADTAQRYVDAGPQRYLWNSGMFVWRADTLMDCIRRYESATHAALSSLAQAWSTPQCDDVIDEVYPTLKKTSVDYAVMEPASRDSAVQVAAIPMPITWLDVGSWPAYGRTCDADDDGNALGAQRHLLLDSRDTLVASSDDKHLIATIGVEGLVIIHTPDATLVCRADRAEDLKALHAKVRQKFGDELV